MHNKIDRSCEAIVKSSGLMKEEAAASPVHERENWRSESEDPVDQPLPSSGGAELKSFNT